MSPTSTNDSKVSARLEKVKAMFKAAEENSISRTEVIRHLMKYGLRKDANA